MGVEVTRYAVRGWGVGELWSRADGTVLAHHFDFDGREATSESAQASRRKRAPDDRSQASSTRALVGRFEAYLAGEDVSFSEVGIDLSWATPLQQALVEELRRIPRGDVVSYGELAALAGHPRAPRAAGAVCAANRYAFIVPCHRVVSANGIGGYGSAGVDVKRRLLALEGVHL